MTSDLSIGIAWYVVFLFSTTCHEAAHAWAALKLGDDTAYRGGQVTLDPWPHIRREPFGMVVVPIASFLLGGWMIGWASAPYDPHWAMNNPRRKALMSLAGPAANLVLFLLAALLIRIGKPAGIFEMEYGQVLSTLLAVFFALNLLLFTFNLLPLPPLDGSGAMLLFLSSEQAQKYLNFMFSPAIQFFGIFVAWKIFGKIYPYVEYIATGILFAGVS